MRIERNSFTIAIIAGLAIIIGLAVWYPGITGKIAVQNKVFSIGVVVRGETYRPGVEGFKKRMQELGYEEGKNVRYDVVFVDKREDLPGAISGLLSRGVDLIHTYSTPATTEAYKQTKTVPIVFGSMGDPLASKTVQSLQTSGTNVTGVSSLSVLLMPKRMEYLLEAAPRAKRIAVPYTPDDIAGASSYRAAEEAASRLGVTLVPYRVSAERTVRDTAAAILRTDVDGIVISSDSAVWANLDAYVAQAKREKLPFAVFDKDMVVKGGLVGYGPDYFITGTQSAVLADKILKGQRPTDLPIEAPQKFILAVNLDTARAIGLTLPRTLLEKADLIIEAGK